MPWQDRDGRGNVFDYCKCDTKVTWEVKRLEGWWNEKNQNKQKGILCWNDIWARLKILKSLLVNYSITILNFPNLIIILLQYVRKCNTNWNI